jgi:hypothetical protein
MIGINASRCHFSGNEIGTLVGSFALQPYANGGQVMTRRRFSLWSRQ